MNNKYESSLGIRLIKERPTPFESYQYAHSYKDYELFPRSKMSVQPPEVRETYIDIPGLDGELDLTEVLTGHPSYSSRDAKFEFTVVDRSRWDYAYSRLMNKVHGKKLYVIVEEDGNYYYTGRLKVNSFKSKKNTATIVVDGHFNPYKVSLVATSEEWLWDPFNFETDVARDYKGLEVDGSSTYTIVGSKMPVRPAFKASASGITVSINGSSPYSVATSGYQTPDNFPEIRDGEYQMTFSGNGTVNVKFEIGSL